MKKLLAFSLILALLFTACLPMGAMAEEAEELDQETLNAGDITIRFSWWGNDATAAILIAGMDAYTAKYPNITFEPEYSGFNGYQEKMMTQLAGGTEPDLIQVDQPWMAELADGDFFADLYQYPDIFDPDKQLDYEHAEEFCVFDGKMLGVSGGYFALSGILIDQVAEEVGFDLSKYGPENLTWDILLEEGTRIHQEHPDYYLTAPDVGALWLQIKTMLKELTGNNVIEDDYTFGFTKEQLLEVYQYVAKCYENGVFEPFNKVQLFQDRLTENPTFTTGHTVMGLNWVSNIKNYPTYLPEGYTCSAFRYPSYGEKQFPGMGTSLVRPMHVICVSKNSENVREVIKALNFIVTDLESAEIVGANRGYSTCATWKEVYDTHPDLMPEQLKKGYELAIASPLTKESAIIGNSEMESAWFDEISKLAYGELTPEEAVESTMTNISALLEEMKLY